LAEGKNVLLEIDVQGGMQIAERLPESVRIFILPPDRETLRVRLSQRGTETRDQLDRRLARAESEIALARSSGCYTYFVVNDTLKEAVDEVRCIIAGKAEKT